MEEHVSARLVLAGVIAAGTALWGWLGWLIVVWAASMALDYLTGTLAAIKNRAWSSEKAREGLWHKAGMVLVVLVTALTDFALSLLLRLGVPGAPLQHSELLTLLALSWYTLTELGSVLENAARISDRVPPWLPGVLKRAADAALGEEAGDERRDG